MIVTMNGNYTYKDGSHARILCVDNRGNWPVISVMPNGTIVEHSLDGKSSPEFAYSVDLYEKIVSDTCEDEKLINRKLIKEILKTEFENPYIKLIKPYLEGDIVHYATVSGQSKYTTRSINIYMLAHKCKEWANKHNYILESDIRGICKFNPDETCCYEEYFEAPSEPEAIFKACEYILNIGNKND